MLLPQALCHKSSPLEWVRTPRGAAPPEQEHQQQQQQRAQREEDRSSAEQQAKQDDHPPDLSFLTSSNTSCIGGANTDISSYSGTSRGSSRVPSDTPPPVASSASCQATLARRGTDTLDVLAQIDSEKAQNLAQFELERVRVRLDQCRTQQLLDADVIHPWPVRQRPHHVEGADWRPHTRYASANSHPVAQQDQGVRDRDQKSTTEGGSRPVFVQVTESRGMGNTAAKSGGGGTGHSPASSRASAPSASGWAYTPVAPQPVRGGGQVQGSSYSSPAGTPSSPLQYAPQTALQPLDTGEGSPGGTPRSPATKRSQSAFTAEPAEPNKLPIVITWTGGGESVELQGSFDNWCSRQPMQQTHTGHQLVRLLTPGVYQYKFIVDGEWKYAADQPAIMDELGNVNNVVEVHEYEPDVPGNLTGFDGLPSPPGSYSCPSLERADFQKDPPMQPPHLQLTLLNLPAAQEWPSCLPRPQHVVLNHVYSQRALKVHACVMGTTTRYKSKYITTVLYKPVHSTPS